MTRLITPWDVGELTQPFVFLGYSEVSPGAQTIVGAPPSIAILTLVLSGALASEDERGNQGLVVAGGFKWTMPGEVAWHAGVRATGEPLRAYHLWIETSPSPTSSAGQSRCISPHEVQEEGPVRVVLGQFGGARSPLVHAPADTNFFHVRLKDGQSWRYAAPDGHNVTWLAVARGGLQLQVGERVYSEQIALFGDSQGVIELQADGETVFVLGSARRSSHPFDLADDWPSDTNLELVERETPRGGRRLRIQSRR